MPPVRRSPTTTSPNRKSQLARSEGYDHADTTNGPMSAPITLQTTAQERRSATSMRIRLLDDDEISSCQAIAIYVKASQQDRSEAAKVWTWIQERLLNCSRNLSKQHFVKVKDAEHFGKVKDAGWITIGPGGGGSVESHWFDLLQIGDCMLQRIEAACLFWMRRNRIYQRSGQIDLSSELGDYPEDDHRYMMGTYLIDILGSRVSVTAATLGSRTNLTNVYIVHRQNRGLLCSALGWPQELACNQLQICPGERKRVDALREILPSHSDRGEI